MITNNGIQMLKLMNLRKVLTAFEPIAGNIGEANKKCFETYRRHECRYLRQNHGS